VNLDAELKEEIDAITSFEDQIENAEKVSEKLEGVEDPQFIPAVLTMFERNASEDDFGVFHAFASYIEQFEADQAVGGSTLGEMLTASVTRAPMWKTCELLVGLLDTNEAAKTLVAALGNENITDTGRVCVSASLRDIVDSSEDEVEDAVLARANEALASL
jgi:hypothetical protein